MPKYNRECFYCGEKYYCCSSCVSNYSWKNTHCSIECFLKSQEETKMSDGVKPIIVNDKRSERTLLRAAFKKDGKTIDIKGYDLDLGKFDCSDKTTRALEEFAYFIVPAEEMESFTLKKKRNINSK